MFRLLCACIALGLSVGIVSDVFFLWRWAVGPPPAAVVGASVIACVWLTVCILRLLSPIELHRNRRSVIPSILFLIPSSYVAWLVVIGYVKLPHGEWDAWAIWNLHARFLYRAGEAWTDMFSAHVLWSHPDYPLLLPSLVASGWALIGKESAAIPAIIAMMFTFATLALLVSAVSFLWGDHRGLAAGLVFLSATDFFAHGSFQLADVPFSFFILLTVVLLYLNERMTNNYWLVLAGVAAGFAATTKNEGFLFIVALVAARLLVAVRSKPIRALRNEFGLFACGLAPVLAIAMAFKFLLSPPNDIFYSAGSFWDRFIQPERYTTIASYFMDEIGRFGRSRISPLLAAGAYMFSFGWPSSAKAAPTQRCTIALLVFILAGYFFVYVITPLPLQWHLDSSFPRLLLHLWPTFVFCIACRGLRFTAINDVKPAVSSHKTWSTTSLVTAGAVTVAVLCTLLFRAYVPAGDPVSLSEGGSSPSESTQLLHIQDIPVLIDPDETTDTKSGHARFEPTPSSASTSGVAFLNYHHSPFASHSTVPASKPVTSGVLAFQNEKGFRTSLSIANPGMKTAGVDFSVRDYTGHLTVPPSSQVSVFLDESPFNVVAPSGILQFHSLEPVVVSALLTFTSATCPFLMTNIPVQSPKLAFAGTTHIPYTVEGGGWSTRLVLANPTSVALSGHLRWYSESGEATGDAAYSVSSGEMRVYESAVLSQRAHSGRVEVIPNHGQPAPYATALMMSIRNPGSGIVTISSMPGDTESDAYVEMSDLAVTEIVIANPQNKAITAQVGWKSESKEFIVPAAGAVTMSLTDYPVLRLAGRGVLRVVTQFPVAVAALRKSARDPRLLTAYTANLEDGSFFPTFAIGGDFTTQFAVFTHHSATASGEMKFFDQLGKRLELPLIAR